MSIKHAIVRSPSKSFVNAINDWYQQNSKEIDRIDFNKAIIQHKKYVQALKSLGLEVIELEPEVKFPDSCFTQDPFLVYGKKALKLNQKVKSREGEGDSIEAYLFRQGIEVLKMEKGYCDGGDVLVLDDLKLVLVGISKRTNIAGFSQVRSFYKRFDFKVISVPVKKCLHLMTAATYLGQGIFLVSDLLDTEATSKISEISQKIILVPDEEMYAVNTISIGKNVLMPKGYKITKGRIEKLGYKVIETPMSEFEKADGGISCLVLLY